MTVDRKSKDQYKGIWLPKAVLKYLDYLINEGYFMNVSEGIRYFVTRGITADRELKYLEEVA